MKIDFMKQINFRYNTSCTKIGYIWSQSINEKILHK